MTFEKKTWTFDELVERFTTDRDLTAERAIWTGTTGNDLADFIPEGFTERRECCRFPIQYVWVDEDDLTLIVHTAVSEEVHAGRISLEVWSGSDAFHDRLDDLAGVAV